MQHIYIIHRLEYRMFNEIMQNWTLWVHGGAPHTIDNVPNILTLLRGELSTTDEGLGTIYGGL